MTTAVANEGAGDTPTVTLTGDDKAGLIYVHTGPFGEDTDSPIVTVTFDTPYAVPPAVFIAPANSSAVGAGAYVRQSDESDVTVNGFTIRGTAALAYEADYYWRYLAVEQ